MILIDANLLVYAFVADLEQHSAARSWLDATLNDPTPVGLPWPSLLSFTRLVSNPRVFSKPVPVARAWRQVEEWLGRPSAWIPTPTERHADTLRTLMPVVDRSHLVPDAHLAALAIEHGLILCSTDGDFARFPSLRWTNPIR